jgi:DNA-binding NarL/FixJ family response regulator
MTRILIADDHAVVRRGLRQILYEAFPFAHLEEATNTAELLKKVGAQEWDMVISDLSMPGENVLDAVRRIKQDFPKLPVLVLSIYPEELYAIRSIKAGASGYLRKDSHPDELLNAVRKVLSGKKYITPKVAEKLASVVEKYGEKAPHEILSDREFEIFKLIASGKTVSEIATLFSLSVSTISTYRTRVLAKMNRKTNADLTLYAMEHKLLE